ncbi:uncharacterized protein LOC116767315 [Danaus plexippus]|uniref:uncharacterized protein LOC116767315 n=1 Tax=Danaus plexippus TaxID=13037 RepID=UPI002AB057B4|nr:uncharacterized protein LOC116767315 [Danaus plexippus]
MEDCTATKPYKQRFKGVENFLRRIAFNLGNTPSQTEVKVISCIPIDVTDLQEKIISLERQLHEAKKQIQEDEPLPESETSNGNEIVTDKNEKNPDNKQIKGDKQGPSTVVNTAFVSQSRTVSYTNKNPAGKMRMQQICGYCEDSGLREESTVGCLEPAPDLKACGSQDNHNEEVEDLNINTKNDAYKKIFQRRKKKQVIASNSNVKTQFIYYAQGSPENPFHLQDNILVSNDNVNQINQLSKSYLNSVLRRQYDPKIVLEEFSDTSQFSKPFCRDVKVKNKLNHPYIYESDECSCCQGKFQNLDKFITNYLTFDALNTSAFKQSQNDQIYYDSNFYDVVPVKDDGNINNKPDISHKKEHKRRPDTKCWPEKYRNKCRYHPFIVKSHKENRAKALSHRKDIDEVRVKRDRARKRDKRNSCQCARNGCIECSNVYTKFENTKNMKMRKSHPVKKILLIDEKVETDMNILLKCNNQSTQSKLLPVEDRTESTLNQIKTILQSVLEEVKTNSNVSTVPEISKKDAIIQKESSQNNLDNSAIFNDFTSKNSCNTNLYLPSCSRQMSQGQYYFPGVPYQQTKCLQNFPVFIHPASRKPMCGCYYRQSSHKTSHNKQAITTTATNTEKKNIPKSCTNETEKLIKEIYKSVTLNMDYPIKENSLSDYEDLKPITIDSVHERPEEKNTNKVDASPRRDMEVEALLSPLISNTNERKYVYTATSTQFQNERLGSSLSVSYTTAGHENRDDTDDREAMKQSRHTIDYEEDESDEFSDETETDETIVPSLNKQNKSEKRGFIQRMFNSVKLFKKRKDTQRNATQVEVTENSDSDETQTVCSVRTKGRKRNMAQMTREQYLKNAGPLDQKYSRRRAPYLEQEYRRQWNEGLMFYEPHERYPAAEPYSKLSASHPRPSPVFWRDYEARTALVEHTQNVNGKIEQGTSSPTCQGREDDKTSKLDWIKRHKLGLRCGEQWKKLILEN